MIKVYPAIFKKEIDDYEETKDYYLIEFPDLYGVTQGKDITDGMEMASDYLGIILSDYIENGEELPEPSEIKDIKTDENSFVTLVSVDLNDYIKETKFDRTTITLPHYLKTRADKMGINYSKTLAEMLEELVF